MQVNITTYHRLAKSVGALLTLMGGSLAIVFATFMFTGTNLLAGGPVNIDGPGLLVLATIGAFTLPLGLSLFSTDDATSARLRIAGYALGLMAVLRLAAFSNPQMRAVLGVTPLIEFFILGGVGLVAYLVRPNTEAPINIHMEVELNVPASEAWQVLAEEFGDVASYARGVRASSMEGPPEVGAVRTCETPSFGPFPALQITEELTEFDRSAMKYAYVAGGELPAMIPTSTNQWSVEPLGETRCRVKSHASVSLKWWALPLAPLLGWSIRSEVVKFGDDLRARVETGQPLPQKPAALASV
ncbi:MAG: SRPBCC family protein [Nannocystales bacterium]